MKLTILHCQAFFVQSIIYYQSLTLCFPIGGSPTLSSRLDLEKIGQLNEFE